MFFLTYLGRELRRRMRQSIVIALGLALGVGLVITVTAASAGVKKAQADVLSSLYGVGTEATVTKTPSAPKNGGQQRITFQGPPPSGSTSSGSASSGVTQCVNGKCHTVTGGTIDNLTSTSDAPFSQASVSSVARLRDVASAVGGLALTDTRITIPTQAHPNVSGPKNFSVDGVDTGHLGLGPLSNATISSGRGLKAGDRDSGVAVVDSNYAIASNIKAGSKVTVGGKPFTVVGLVKQSQGSGAPDVYIPLARAQALATVAPGSSSHLKNEVNTLYVSAASATDIAVVQKEIQHLLPGDTVTTAASLASQVTGSVSSTAKLAGDLGRWLSILVLIAAFALACLMTLAAVSRRVREFGTLKALGWRSRRLVGQVMGEAVVTGVAGGAVGVGLGYLGATVISKTAHKLTASVSEATGQHFFNATSGGTSTAGPVSANPDVTHTVYVPLVAQVGLGVVVAAVLLAVLGGLLAGTAGGWRISRLRPAVALASVE
ncbi:MAG TPA: ABC transporter permease [Streptosporangiaceae bacterium]|jgi:putative ABC transport system permease protein